MMTAPLNCNVYSKERLREVLHQCHAKISRYSLFFYLMKLRAAKHGTLGARTFRLVSPLRRRDKPFFVGTTSDGTRFLGDIFDHQSLLWAILPDYESRTLQIIGDACGELPGAFIDVGANCAVLAASVARRQPERLVIAFEPDPQTALRAAATFALNNLQNAIVVQAAVGESDGQIEFFRTLGQSDVSSTVLTQSSHRAEVERMTVPLFKLDTVLPGLLGATPVSLLKVDVEGLEPAVFRGAAGILASHAPTVIFEYVRCIAQELGWTAEDVQKILEKDRPLSYQWFSDHGFGVPTPDSDEVWNIICKPRR